METLKPENNVKKKAQPKYLSELRERGIRMVFDHQHEYATQWAAIQSIATKLSCSAESLRNWVRQAEKDRGLRSGQTTQELERQARELRQVNEILRKASTYFRTGGTRPPTEIMVSFIDEQRASHGHRIDLQGAAERAVDVLSARGPTCRSC